MQIVQVSVEYSRTWNLGNYSNVKPGIVITAALADGESSAEAMDDLQRRAREHVEQVIDQALEQQGDAPEFFTGPRYDVILARDARLVAVIPSGLQRHLPGAWAKLPAVVSRFRHLKALEAATGYDQCRLVDCSDGDLSRLPLLENFKIFRASPERFETGYLLLTTADVYLDDLPQTWRDYGLYNGGTSVRTREAFLDEMEQKAYDEGLALLTGFTPDELAALPPLKRREEERPGPSDDVDEDDDYDDYDDDDDLDDDLDDDDNYDVREDWE